MHVKTNALKLLPNLNTGDNRDAVFSVLFICLTATRLLKFSLALLGYAMLTATCQTSDSAAVRVAWLMLHHE